MKTSAFDSYLVSGNITIFVGSHTDNFKKDILASSLLAELVAEQQSNDRIASLPTYTDTLKKVGWILNSRSSQRIEFINSSLFDVIDESVGSALSQDNRKELANAFSQIAALSNDSTAYKEIVEKLQKNAKANTASSAALLTIVRNDKTVVTLQMTFETAEALATNILNLPVLNAITDRKTNVWMVCSALDARHYNDVRSEVLKKLGRKIETEILHIQPPQQ
ncbi:MULTISPECIES: hypothetical protein [unclassified Pseudomonas]|uniref:hypothetical protein n=1 Tax=unclassified Pseudomonas TaxID=196821 RepID=UPI000BA397F4|nr:MULTISPECIES: hypothetical protein [unclassified Pseudomonas]MDN4547865.1 hypothetical protein [Pseudomonas sp. C32]